MKNLLLLLFMLTGLTGFSKVVIITNLGAKFDPADVSVNLGDTIQFNLSNTHNVLEVDKTAWDAEENVPLSGGFSLPKGGGMLLTATLTKGAHYYICTPHITLGMKGLITINPANGISENQLQQTISIFPVPAHDLITVKIKSANKNTYSIFDNAGKQVMAGRFEGDETTIPVSGLASGIYFFQTEGYRKKIFSIKK